MLLRCLYHRDVVADLPHLCRIILPAAIRSSSLAPATRAVYLLFSDPLKQVVHKIPYYCYIVQPTATFF